MAADSNLEFRDVRHANTRIRHLRITAVVVMMALAAGVGIGLSEGNAFPWLPAGEHTRLIYLASLILLVTLFAVYWVFTHKELNAERDATLKSELERRALLRRAEDLKFLLHAAGRLGPEAGPEETLPLMLGELTGLLRAEYGALFMPPRGGGLKDVVRVAEFSSGIPRPDDQIAPDETLGRRVIEQGRAELQPADPERQQPARLACPLPLEGKLRGAIVLTAGSDELETFSEHHVELLALFSNNAASAFNYGRRFGRLRDQHESLRESYKHLMQERGTVAASARVAAAARASTQLHDRIAEQVSLATVVLDQLLTRALPEEVEDEVRSVRAYLGEIIEATQVEETPVEGKLDESLDEMVEAVVALRSYACRQVLIEVQLSLGAQQVKLDHRAAAFRQCLEEVLDHSIGNLLQGTPPRRLMIETSSAGARARVTVRDNGPEIDLSQLPQILSERTRRRRNADIKVGLFAAAGVLRRAGGDLSVKPHPGGGTSYVLDTGLLRTLVPA